MCNLISIEFCLNEMQSQKLNTKFCYMKRNSCTIFILQNIRFSTPLTLILGQNGSGKTTIIECIKYALTGDFPPNCKNGVGFINNPFVLHTNESLGQVKLRVSFPLFLIKFLIVLVVNEIQRKKWMSSIKIRAMTIHVKD